MFYTILEPGEKIHNI